MLFNPPLFQIQSIAKGLFDARSILILVPLAGFEPAVLTLEGFCFIQLSYGGLIDLS